MQSLLLATTRPCLSLVILLIGWAVLDLGEDEPALLGQTMKVQAWLDEPTEARCPCPSLHMTGFTASEKGSLGLRS